MTLALCNNEIQMLLSLNSITVVGFRIYFQGRGDALSFWFELIISSLPVTPLCLVETFLAKTVRAANQMIYRVVSFKPLLLLYLE